LNKRDIVILSNQNWRYINFNLSPPSRKGLVKIHKEIYPSDQY